jgi:nicotinate-nucleotide adenylyltransferase
VALAILGGTFDPVHNAHLAMARAAVDQLKLERVIFLPTGSPHYRQPAVASSQDRVAMLTLAIQGEPRYRISIGELASTASGYTVDTLKRFKKEHPQDEIFLLMGGDQYSKFESWRQPDEISRLARLVVFARPGFPIEGRFEATVVPMAPSEISASDIRERVARGRTIANLVPEPVWKYIMQHKLYH